MDLVLPGIDGFKAYSESFTAVTENCCVMITGHSIENLAERASAQGIRHVLCKPFPLIELQSLVDKSTEEYFDEMRLSVQGIRHRVHRRHPAPAITLSACHRVYIYLCGRACNVMLWGRDENIEVCSCLVSVRMRSGSSGCRQCLRLYR